jgi:hypothetical protein
MTNQTTTANLERAVACGATIGVRLARTLDGETDSTYEFSADQLDAYTTQAVARDAPEPVLPKSFEPAIALLESLATPRSEPLNSVTAYRDKASRFVHANKIRNLARDALAATRGARP